MGTVTNLRRSNVKTWGGAVDRFLSTRDLSSGSQRVYRLTLERVGGYLGTAGLKDVTASRLTKAVEKAYPTASANSWNRHVATVRSFTSFCLRQGWITRDIATGLERRSAPVDHTRALSRPDIERLLARKDVPVRDRCLWRMLYETAARANEVLRLNIEDLNLAQRRATTIRKGGALDTIHWASGTARLLPYVIGDRETGPLFLSSRPVQQRRAPAKSDLDPTGQFARLSYARAAQIFSEATGGWTLHQLRHSALTHYAEGGVALPMLMAKSRHESLRTLQRYVRPSTEAVAKMTADHDRVRRR
jgi:integrase